MRGAPTVIQKLWIPVLNVNACRNSHAALPLTVILHFPDLSLYPDLIGRGELLTNTSERNLVSPKLTIDTITPELIGFRATTHTAPGVQFS